MFQRISKFPSQNIRPKIAKNDGEIGRGNINQIVLIELSRPIERDSPLCYKSCNKGFVSILKRNHVRGQKSCVTRGLSRRGSSLSIGLIGEVQLPRQLNKFANRAIYPDAF